MRLRIGKKDMITAKTEKYSSESTPTARESFSDAYTMPADPVLPPAPYGEKTYMSKLHAVHITPIYSADRGTEI